MASVKWEAGTFSTVMTTELGSKALDDNSISSEIDNSTDLYLFDDVEIHVESGYGGGFQAGDHYDLYLVREQLDGTGYEDGDASIDPPAANLVGVFVLGSNASAETHILRQISIPPSKFKYVAINRCETSSSSTASGSVNYLRRRPYRYQTN